MVIQGSIAVDTNASQGSCKQKQSTVITSHVGSLSCKSQRISPRVVKNDCDAKCVGVQQLSFVERSQVHRNIDKEKTNCFRKYHTPGDQ